MIRTFGVSGQFGRVTGQLEILEASENTKLDFVNDTIGTNVPNQYMPGVKRGFMTYCEKSVITGNKVYDVKCF